MNDQGMMTSMMNNQDMMNMIGSEMNGNMIDISQHESMHEMISEISDPIMKQAIIDEINKDHLQMKDLLEEHVVDDPELKQSPLVKTEKQYTKANDVSIHTVFSFREKIEESDGFQAYTQVSGFDRSSGPPIFKLEGVMDSDRAYLYKAVDTIFQRGVSNTQHDYGQFDVDVYLHKDDIPLRHFKYVDCSVNDYKITTLFDKEEGWTSNKGFATIDEFVFECSGYKPINPLLD